MPVRGTIITRVETGVPKGATASGAAQAARIVAADIEAELKRRCGRTPSPPRSRPGQYPKLETGAFQQGINVTGTNRYITVASVEEYGFYLEEGTLNMAPRPWASKQVDGPNGERWGKMYVRLARELSRGGRKR